MIRMAGLGAGQQPPVVAWSDQPHLERLHQSTPLLCLRPGPHCFWRRVWAAWSLAARSCPGSRPHCSSTLPQSPSPPPKAPAQEAAWGGRGGRQGAVEASRAEGWGREQKKQEDSTTHWCHSQSKQNNPYPPDSTYIVVCDQLDDLFHELFDRHGAESARGGGCTNGGRLPAAAGGGCGRRQLARPLCRLHCRASAAGRRSGRGSGRSRNKVGLCRSSAGGALCTLTDPSRAPRTAREGQLRHKRVQAAVHEGAPAALPPAGRRSCCRHWPLTLP